MGFFDFITKPQTHQIPLDRVLAYSRDYRQVIPSEKARDYQGFDITEERMERYFQVKPQINRPNIAAPGGAIAMIVISALAFLIGLVAARSLFFLVLLGLVGVAGGIYWIYTAYAPVRNYLLPLENYLLRDTLTFNSYENWMNAKVMEIITTTSRRLHISLDEIVQSGPNQRIIGDPRLIAGYYSHPVVRSRSSIKFFFAQDARRFFSLEFSLFDVADHVDYMNNQGVITKSHWRIISYLFVLPQDNALAVYETTIDAINLKSINDVTSEYFYQSVLGLRTSVKESATSTRPEQTEFTLLIGHGFSPSIITSNDLGPTIKLLREAISDRKERALRKEAAAGSGRVSVPGAGSSQGFNTSGRVSTPLPDDTSTFGGSGAFAGSPSGSTFSQEFAAGSGASSERVTVPGLGDAPTIPGMPAAGERVEADETREEVTLAELVGETKTIPLPAEPGS